jgi:hypothetical protein
MPQEVCWKRKQQKPELTLCGDDRLCHDSDEENERRLAANHNKKTAQANNSQLTQAATGSMATEISLLRTDDGCQKPSKNHAVAKKTKNDIDNNTPAAAESNTTQQKDVIIKCVAEQTVVKRITFVHLLPPPGCTRSGSPSHSTVLSSLRNCNG